MREVLLPTPEDTLAFGEFLGAAVPGGLVIALRGDLGAGKTVLSKGLGLGLGVGEEVTSPTFTIVSEYEGRLRLHHMDAYRLTGAEDFFEIGGEELLRDKAGVCLIEWSERIASALPRETESIDLKVEDGGARRAFVYGSILEALALAYGNKPNPKDPR